MTERILISDLDDRFFKFIEENFDADLHKLSFSPGNLKNQDLKRFALTQIEIRRKHLSKFFPLLQNNRFIFPDKSVTAQSSNARLALYHASLIEDNEIVADLTAGLGMDSIAMAGKAKKVYSIEVDAFRAEILSLNSNLLGVPNIEVVRADGVEWLKSTDLTFGTIYLDPARRDQHDNRKLLLEDYSPNVLELMDLMPLKCNRLLIKVSPLLDISSLHKKLPCLSGIHIVEYQRECKELLLDVNFNHGGNQNNLEIRCVTLEESGNWDSFSFNYEMNNSIHPVIASADDLSFLPNKWVYEPAPSVMKASCWGIIGERFPNIKKIGTNTHLFLSDEIIKNFPGRAFKVKEVLKFRDLKKYKKGNFNVISRNYPLNANEISSKFGFIPSGDEYFIALGTNFGKLVLKTTHECYG